MWNHCCFLSTLLLCSNSRSQSHPNLFTLADEYLMFYLPPVCVRRKDAMIFFPCGFSFFGGVVSLVSQGWSIYLLYTNCYHKNTLFSPGYNLKCKRSCFGFAVFSGIVHLTKNARKIKDSHLPRSMQVLWWFQVELSWHMDHVYISQSFESQLVLQTYALTLPEWQCFCRLSENSLLNLLTL